MIESDSSVALEGTASRQTGSTGVLTLRRAWARWILDHWVDLALAGGLFVVAAAVRLPYLQLIPQLTDETGDVLWALDIYRGVHLPLTQNDPYNGPVLGYLLAAAFWLFGVSVELPRLVMLVLGSLTVVLTYALARVLGSDEGTGRRLGIGYWILDISTSNPQYPIPNTHFPGLIAAGLMTTAFVPVVINSHLVWSNCSTPFFVTLALVALAVADRRRSGPWLALAGLLLGVAVQTHPSALVIIPGLVAWFLLRRERRAWLRTPWPYLAALLALLAYSNILWYNLQTGFGSIGGAQKRTYALTTDLSIGGYVTNVVELLIAVVRMVSSTFPKESQVAGTLELPALLVYGTLLAAGLFRDARRGDGLPLAILVSTGLFMPIFNKFYGPALMSRYIAYLLPLCSVALGGLLAGWLDGIADWKSKPITSHKSQTRNASRPILLAFVILLIAYPAVVLRDHYARESAKGGTNAVLLTLADFLHQVQQVDDTFIYLERDLRDLPLRAGGHVLKGLSYLLTLEGARHDSRNVNDLEADLAARTGAWLVLTEGGAARLGERYDLLPVDFGLPPDAALPGGFRLYALGDVYVPRVFTPPAEIPLPAQVHLGSGMSLLGGAVNATALQPGETLLLTLYWQGRGPVDVDYTVFTHLAGAEKRIWAQHDGQPAGNRRPTTGWVQGEIIVDEHALPLAPDTPPGRYWIEVGMYDLTTLARVPVSDAQGQPVPGDQVFLPVEIEVR